MYPPFQLLRQPGALVVLILLFIGFSASSQNRTFRDYYQNDQEIFSKIDTNYFSAWLNQYHIRGLVERSYWYDSSGVIIDHSIANEYVFDDHGRIIEKRFDFRTDSTYRVIRYAYTSDQKVVEHYEDPFGLDVLDGAWIAPTPQQYSEYTTSHNQVEKIELTDYRGDNYTMELYYDDGLVLPEPDCRALISSVDFSENGKLVWRNVVTYER